MNKNLLIQTLNFAYEKSVNGFGILQSSYELAQDYLSKYKTPERAAEELIKWQVAKCATSGFLSGLGGIITLPIAIPTSVASVIYVQLRMICAIAVLGKYDLKSDKVKSLVYTTMTGSAAIDILKSIGVKVGQRLTQNVIKNISVKVIRSINQKVGMRLLTKFGQTGAVNLGKAIPIIGAIVGGTVDGVSTRVIGNIAKKVFLNFEKEYSVHPSTQCSLVFS